MDPDIAMVDDVESNAPAPIEGTAPIDSGPVTMSQGRGAREAYLHMMDACYSDGASSRGAPIDIVVRSEGRAPVRTYAICACEEASSLDVITGTFSLHDISVVVLIDPGSTHSYVEPDESDDSPVVISSMIVERYLRKGYKSCLAFLLNNQVSEVKIETVPVVCEYLDVFPKEFPGLPSTREVEFGIELVLGTAFILITRIGWLRKN
ncbi:uncharacterized protein [Gossypium hirsutum]|uniref:Uncharacterized protein n=1 Tax=Gossypium hirsutum TaxID=3635 RepID=A0ABM3BWE3_GOSHI|nr:uncharacterized protein LOC121230534 [Gossypium hirsutum]